MKEEHLDWLLYRVLAEGSFLSISELTEKTGLQPAEVERSLQRLDRVHLIERKGNEVRTLSLHEILIRYHLASTDDLPYYLENNVIRLKRREKNS